MTVLILHLPQLLRARMRQAEEMSGKSSAQAVSQHPGISVKNSYDVRQVSTANNNFATVQLQVRLLRDVQSNVGLLRKSTSRNKSGQTCPAFTHPAC